MAPFGLFDYEVAELRSVLAKFPEIREAIIYGSRARSDARTGSDIDMTLIGNDISHDVLFRLSDDIDDLMQPYYFDLTIFAELKNARLIESINKEGKVFYHKAS